MRVADVAHRDARQCVQHPARHEVSSRCHAVHIVITHKVKTSVQFQVVHPLVRLPPSLVGHHPCALHRRECAKGIIAQLHTFFGILAKLARTIQRHCRSHIVTFSPVIVGSHVISQVHITVVQSSRLLILQSTRHIGRLVVACIVTHLRVQLVCVPQIAPSILGFQQMTLPTTLPGDAKVVHDSDLSSSQSTGAILHHADAFHFIFRHTRCGHIIVLVRVHQLECEVIRQRPSLADAPLRLHGYRHSAVAKRILVLALTILENRDWIRQ